MPQVPYRPIKIHNSMLREPFLLLSDSIIRFKKVEPKNDEKLRRFNKELDLLWRKVHEHLEKNYLYD